MQEGGEIDVLFKPPLELLDGTHPTPTAVADELPQQPRLGRPHHTPGKSQEHL
jgi:hypothetical protein